MQEPDCPPVPPATLAHLDATTILAESSALTSHTEPSSSVIRRRWPSSAVSISLRAQFSLLRALAHTAATLRGHSCPVATTVRISYAPSTARARKRSFNAETPASLLLLGRSRSSLIW